MTCNVLVRRFDRVYYLNDVLESLARCFEVDKDNIRAIFEYSYAKYNGRFDPQIPGQTKRMADDIAEFNRIHAVPTHILVSYELLCVGLSNEKVFTPPPGYNEY